MSFLTPLYLAGALAIAAPILFHLIRRVTRHRTPFSSLMFLQASPPRFESRKRIEHVLLLALRCAVLALLALAFARPFLPQTIADAPPVTPGRSVVLLIDASASMQRTGLWEQAMRQARRELDDLTPDDQLAVITFDRNVAAMVDFDQFSAAPLDERQALVNAKLNDLKPGWSESRLGAGLVAAAELIEDARTSQAQGRVQRPGRIVLIGDIQSGSRLDELQAYSWPKDTHVRLAAVNAELTTNAGLQLVTDVTSLAVGPDEHAFRVRVTNAADSQREQFTLQWLAEGAAPDQAATVDVYVPPGQSRVIPPPGSADQKTRGRLVLAGDDHPFDNELHIAPQPVEPVRLMYVGGEKADDASMPLYYLSRAMLQTRAHDPQVATLRAGDLVVSSALAKAHLLIVAEPLAQRDEPAARAFVEHGGTVLLLLTSADMAESIRIITGIDASAREASVRDYAMLGRVDMSHPLLRAFADPRFGDFTRIHYWRYRSLTLPQDEAIGVLAAYDNGDPAWVEWPLGRGRLIVMTAGWQPSDSQLALSSKFVPLVYAMLEHIGSLNLTARQYLVGDAVSIEALRGEQAGDQPAAIAHGGGEADSLTADEKSWRPSEPGLYEVTTGAVTQFVAVNVPPGESRTEPAPAENLEHLGVALDEGEQAILAARQQIQIEELQRNDTEQRQKLWRWVIAAALAVAVVETALAGWMNRQGALAEGN